MNSTNLMLAREQIKGATIATCRILLCLLLTATAGHALAAPMMPNGEVRYSYPVKFICGDQFFGGFPQPPNVARMPGNYAVSINVHNPQISTVAFSKKAILLEEGRPIGIGPPSQTPQAPSEKVPEKLPPNWALQMVCSDVATLLGINPLIPIAPAIEGFVVIESPHELDVTAVYTYKNIERAVEREQPLGVGVGVGASIDVERIEPTIVVIPEPSTIGLAGLALGTFFIMKARRPFSGSHRLVNPFLEVESMRFVAGKPKSIQARCKRNNDDLR